MYTFALAMETLACNIQVNRALILPWMALESIKRFHALDHVCETICSW